MKTLKAREPRLEMPTGIVEREGESRTAAGAGKVKHSSPQPLPFQSPPSIQPEALDHTCSNCPVTFAITAPDATAVHVAGSFNNWDPQATALAKGINGDWTAHLMLDPGQYEYRFIVDGAWKEDPAATSSLPNPFGERNSVLIVN